MLNIWFVSSIFRTMGPGIKRCKWKWHHYYCEWFISKKFFFLSSSSCWFCWSVGLQRKECFWQKIQGDSPELEAKTATWPLWAPLPLNQQGNMGITTLARRTDPDYQREIGKAESLCCPLETITTLLIGYACMLSPFSHVWLCVTPRTVAHQDLLSMEFSRQEYWRD